MRRQLPAALGMLLILTVVTGLAYPLLVTGIAQVAFGDQADGSLVERDSEVVGSELLAQAFAEPEYFHPRPSAVEYDAADSGASNLGPSNADLRGAAEQLAVAYREENDLANDTEVPVDAVTKSASGLDPHISVANALLQAPRVAEERDLDVDEVLDLVNRNTDQRALGFLGEDGVNVLQLNLALDDLES